MPMYRHHYEVFNVDQLALSPDDHIKAACGFGDQMAASVHPTISGEWTGGMTDCAKWLNGKNKGARYDGTFQNAPRLGSCDGKSSGTVASLSPDDKYNIGRLVEAQLEGYEKAAGWIFWTWKTEGAPEWDMQDLLANGLFPNPVNDPSARKCKSFLCMHMYALLLGFTASTSDDAIKTCFDKWTLTDDRCRHLWLSKAIMSLCVRRRRDRLRRQRISAQSLSARHSLIQPSSSPATVTILTNLLDFMDTPLSAR